MSEKQFVSVEYVYISCLYRNIHWIDASKFVIIKGSIDHFGKQKHLLRTGNYYALLDV
jgi:hypothetical protein